MASYEYELSAPPSDLSERKLWLQHAAGFILIEDVRKYALDRLPPNLGVEAVAAARAAVDDALYGVMMLADGVTGALRSDDGAVTLGLVARLQRGGDVVDLIDLADGDGACMGYHQWIEGDFGPDAVVVSP